MYNILSGVVGVGNASFQIRATIIFDLVVEFAPKSLFLMTKLKIMQIVLASRQWHSEVVIVIKDCTYQTQPLPLALKVILPCVRSLNHIRVKGAITSQEGDKMKLIDTTPTLYPPLEAEKVAAEMQKGDPDWTYKVKHDPAGHGYSLIEVYGEDGEFVANV